MPQADRRTPGLHTEGIFERLDQLNEFERQPVTADKLQPGRYFAAVFSGEHIAATEFVIGVLFVRLGGGAFDVLVGLLLGNLLAVLSWALVCAPIAVQTRLTLYWYLRRIAGPAVTVVYNLLNGVLHCILAGAMITVSASAVRIPLGIAAEKNWYPTNPAYVILVLCVGAVVVTLAVWGFEKLARFASLCSPWMSTMFVGGGLIGLSLLGTVRGWDDFWQIANEHVWRGPTEASTEQVGFWHVAAFAWVCNLATHLGLSDMALFRYARRASYGFYSAFGMYLGHYLSWICAGIMGAAAAVATQRSLENLDSGDIATTVLGAMGALCVVIAGWTTANPTLYRGGLALQIATPGWPRWLVTLLAGALTTIVACFPFVFTKLLDFVALFGLLLMPVGAIVVVEHWIFPWLGWTQFWSSRRGQWVNGPALASWAVAVGTALALWYGHVVHPFFLAVPIWLLAAVLYLVLAKICGAGVPPAIAEDVPPRAGKTPAPQMAQPQPGAGTAAPRGSLYWVSGGMALACLALSVFLPFLAFLGELERESVNQHLIWLTLGYFVAGTVWMTQRPASAGPS